MANHQPSNVGNGPPSGGMGGQHSQGAQGTAPTQSMSQQNLNQIVRLSILFARGLNLV